MAICQKLLAYARESKSYDSADELLMLDDKVWLDEIKVTSAELSKVKMALGRSSSLTPQDTLTAAGSGNR